MITRLLNLCWLALIGLCVWFAFTPGLLGLIALFVMDGVLELKAIRRAIDEPEAPSAEPSKPWRVFRRGYQPAEGGGATGGLSFAGGLPGGGRES